MVMGMLAEGSGWEVGKGVVNALCRPEWVLTAATAMVVLGLVCYRRWTKPMAAGILSVMLLGAFAAAMVEPNFREIVTKPDNVAIVGMLMTVAFFLWVALRRAAINDGPIQGESVGLAEPRTYVWPDLVYIELICLLAASVGLIVWSILVKAPLEQPANPAYAPNPAKAPWYFVGLQELLVYFDPWMGGVVYPLLAVFGLCAIPFIDRSPKRSGYYTLKGRRLAIGVWLFGFIVLWIVPILIGTFLRGPNWSVFGVFEPWDVNKHQTIRNVDLSQMWWEGVLGRGRPTDLDNPIPWLKYWLVREWVGMLLVGVYLIGIPIALGRTVLRRMRQQMGTARYAVMIFLLLMMGLLVIKMVLRWTAGLKYFIYLPELNVNL